MSHSASIAKRNVMVLATAQALGGASAPIIMSLGGLVGQQLSDDPAWITLPVSLFGLGLAIGTLPAAFALRRWDEAAELLEGAESPWKPEQLEEALAPFFEEHGELRFDPAARSPKHTLIEEAEGVWRVRQVLVDPGEHLDWSIAADIDLARAREEGRPVLELRSVGPS